MTDAARKLEASRRGFDQWAPSYESDRRSRRIATLQLEAFEALGLGPEDRMLDVGCGSGAAVRRAAQLGRGAAGAGLPPGMIRRAEELPAGGEDVESLDPETSELPSAG